LKKKKKLDKESLPGSLFSLNLIDKQDLNSYIYHISSKSGSGEYALSTILAPGAFARWPLMDRLKHLKMPTVFMCKLSLRWILSARLYSSEGEESSRSERARVSLIINPHLLCLLTFS
jgi:hypothetical protein